jgi:hypothetical protein
MAKAASERSHQRVANKAVIEHWNGTAWSIVASPAGLISVDRISAASATDIWASGQAPQQTIAGIPVPVARTVHWNGTAWSAMPGPTGPGYRRCRRVRPGRLAPPSPLPAPPPRSSHATRPDPRRDPMASASTS